MYPEQEDIWNVEDEYMFGPNLLVAPVLYEKVNSRKVVLPAGTQWICINTNKVYEGGKTICVETPLDTIPVFTNDKRMKDEISGSWK